MYFINMKISFSALMVFQAFTIAIGIIPITALTLIKHGYLNRRNILSAEKITHDIKPQPIQPEPGKFLQIVSESGKEEIGIDYSDLVYIKSDGHYITVGYMKNGRFTRSLVRNTMKFAEDIMAPYPSGFRCHRSWLVNLDKIVRVTGNSQGLKLILEGPQEPVPVARNLAADFKRIMQERNG
jgi:DNA-binding LytR/AlgR family response regulator